MEGWGARDGMRAASRLRISFGVGRARSRRVLGEHRYIEIWVLNLLRCSRNNPDTLI